MNDGTVTITLSAGEAALLNDGCGSTLAERIGELLRIETEARALVDDYRYAALRDPAALKMQPELAENIGYLADAVGVTLYH